MIPIQFPKSALATAASMAAAPNETDATLGATVEAGIAGVEPAAAGVAAAARTGCARIAGTDLRQRAHVEGTARELGCGRGARSAELAVLVERHFEWAEIVQRLAGARRGGIVQVLECEVAPVGGGASGSGVEHAVGFVEECAIEPEAAGAKGGEFASVGSERESCVGLEPEEADRKCSDEEAPMARLGAGWVQIDLALRSTDPFEHGEVGLPKWPGVQPARLGFGLPGPRPLRLQIVQS